MALRNHWEREDIDCIDRKRTKESNLHRYFISEGINIIAIIGRMNERFKTKERQAIGIGQD
jgi:hypothetical protein